MLTSAQVNDVEFTSKKLRESYDVDEVDDYLDRIVATLQNWETGRPLGESAVSAHDVLHVHFSSAGMFKSGYDADQVDDFLDDVCDVLSEYEKQAADAAPNGPEIAAPAPARPAAAAQPEPVAQPVLAAPPAPAAMPAVQDAAQLAATQQMQPVPAAPPDQPVAPAAQQHAESTSSSALAGAGRLGNGSHPGPRTPVSWAPVGGAEDAKASAPLQRPVPQPEAPAAPTRPSVLSNPDLPRPNPVAAPSPMPAAAAAMAAVRPPAPAMAGSPAPTARIAPAAVLPAAADQTSPGAIPAPSVAEPVPVGAGGGGSSWPPASIDQQVRQSNDRRPPTVVHLPALDYQDSGGYRPAGSYGQPERASAPLPPAATPTMAAMPAGQDSHGGPGGEDYRAPSVPAPMPAAVDPWRPPTGQAAALPSRRSRRHALDAVPDATAEREPLGEWAPASEPAGAPPTDLAALAASETTRDRTETRTRTRSRRAATDPAGQYSNWESPQAVTPPPASMPGPSARRSSGSSSGHSNWNTPDAVPVPSRRHSAAMDATAMVAALQYAREIVPSTSQDNVIVVLPDGAQHTVVSITPSPQGVVVHLR